VWTPTHQDESKKKLVETTEHGTTVFFSKANEGMARLVASLITNDTGSPATCVVAGAITGQPCMHLSSAVWTESEAKAAMLAAVEMAGTLLQITLGVCMAAVPDAPQLGEVPDHVAAEFVSGVLP
jgi:hypothetical protein